jgi:hypothetical protein
MLLLTTVAAAALVGYAGSAAAQTMQNPSSGAGAGAAAKSENTKPAESKGALSGAIKGDVPGGHAQSASPEHAKSAQESSPAAKSDQKLGPDEPKQIEPKQNAEEEKPAAKTQTGANDSDVQQRGAQQENAKDNAKSGMNSAEQNGKANGSHGSVQLSQTQRTKIEAIVGKGSAARVSHVTFDVSVGVKIPSDVHVAVLPTEVVEVVPQFRGYDYIIVGDNILIIDPDSLEIVDIIAA